MHHRNYLPYLFAFLAILFWGLSFVWSKIVFRYYEPIATIFIRLLISSVILVAVWAFFFKNERIRREDYGLLLLSAFFSPFCYFLGENFGLKEVSSSIASVIIATIPVFTPFVAFLLLNEKLSRLNLAGMFISFFGVLLMLLKKDLSLNASLRGISLLLFAVISAVSYGICIRKLSMKYHPLTIVCFQNLLGTIYFLPLFLYFDLGDFMKVPLRGPLLFSMLSLAIFASSLAFIMFTAAVRHLGIGRTNIFTNLIPVITAVASYMLLHETFTAAKILGIVVVIAGVIMAQLPAKVIMNQQ